MQKNKINWELVAPLIVTILLAISGYIYTHFADLENEQNSAKIDRVNDQLRNLYGPLYSFASVSEITWQELILLYPALTKIDSVNPKVPLTEVEQEEYRKYMLKVIQPLQLNAENAILNYSDLIDEKEMPTLFKELVAHISDSKKLYSNWANGDYSRHIPINKYPADFRTYITKEYNKLKSRQMELLGIQ